MCADSQNPSNTGDDFPKQQRATDNNMMAPTQNGFGWKRRIDLWTHFIYNLAERRTQCTVVTGDGETPCGYKLGGNNTTNQNRHLKVHHSAIYAMVS